MLNLEETLWAGSESSLQTARNIQLRMVSAIQAGGFQSGEEDGPPYMLAGSVAIIPVYGPLVNVDSPWLKYFGVTGYPDLRRAAVAAAGDPNVAQILLDVNSPGGAVSGIADTGDLLARINSRVKPVTTFSGADILSAAYWLGVSAGQVFVSRTSSVGSVGVITTHSESTGALALEGVKTTVLRAGKYKSLASPFEVLSDDARAQIQEELDAAYKVFVQHVADSRGVTYAVADEKYAQGRKFFGAGAKAAGLVDGISSLDAVVSGLQAKKIDKSTRRI